MSETIVGILGFLTIAAIVVTLFKSKTLPSIAFIVFPTILAVILVIGGYYDFEQVGKLIKSGFSSTEPDGSPVRIQCSVFRYHDRCRYVRRYYRQADEAGR